MMRSQIKRFAFAHACERVRLKESTGRGGHTGRIVGWMTTGVIVALDDASGWPFDCGTRTIFSGISFKEGESGWVVLVSDLELIEEGVMDDDSENS